MFRWIASLGPAMRRVGRSLRWRILAWYSVILALSLLVISLLLLWQTARGVWVDVDSDLMAGAKLIDGGMRRLPPEVLATFSPDAGLRRDTIHRPPPGGPPWDSRPRRPAGPDDVNRPMRPPRGGPPNGGERPLGPPPRNPPEGMRFPAPDGPGGEMPMPRSNAWLVPDIAPAPLELDAFLSDEQSPDEPAPDWAPQRDAFERSLDWIRLERMAPLRLGIEDSRAYSLVWSADGTLLHRSRLPREDIDLGEDEIKSIAFANPTNRTMRQMRGPFREVLLRGPDESVICVGMDASREIERIGAYALFLLLSCGTVFGIALVGGNWCLKRTLQPLREMETTSAAIHAEHLDCRFDVASMDREVADVASSINTMLDRLQQGFEQQKQFTADASHELRTPLAIMLSSTELALSRDRSAEVYKRELEKCQRAASRMHGLVDRLLTLSRLDSQSLEPPNETIALDAIAIEQIELLRSWAGERNIALSAEVEPCSLAGDADAMGRL
ncbi:MAG: histidine kinase dimerization/phospho-acceptor domain-containing protein, partial [Pirellula sp.]